MDNEKSAKILIVDDSEATLELIQRNLISKGYTVFTAPGIQEAMSILDKTSLDLVVTDLKMPKGSGMDIVKYVRENLEDTQVMMVTGYATVDGAVRAVKEGAEEYLSKPFTDEELFGAVKRSLDKLEIRRKSRNGITKVNNVWGLVGESDEMNKIFINIQKAAKSDATVIISGESGSGKELVARAIHYSSRRARAPFVTVNCGSIPEGLLESELFGHVRGAFTGAFETRAGFFQTADGGTIFLDEISETPPSMQVKLLRVLQNGEINMVGETKKRMVNVRIIAATNKNMDALIKKGSFRDDLYFRLNVVNIEMPLLRQRGDDIILLARHFADKYAKTEGKTAPEFSDKVIEIFTKYNWPGNVRELENLIQRLIVMSDENIIDVTDLPAHMRYSYSQNGGFDRTLKEVEGEYISNVLSSVRGNKTKAAKILGIDRKTLREKLKTN